MNKASLCITYTRTCLWDSEGTNEILKIYFKDWRDGWAVKTTCSCRGLGFNALIWLSTVLTPVPGDLLASSGLHACSTQKHADKTSI